MARAYARLHNQQSVTDVRFLLTRKIPFTNVSGALYGRAIDAHTDVSKWNFGDLPEAWIKIMRKWAHPDYMVYSNKTLIAWHVASTDQWYIPDHYYNNKTMGQHQEIVSRAIYGQTARPWITERRKEAA